LHKNYALFWSSDLIASVGQFVREVALYWLAYEITGSVWALGILGFCEAAPRLLFGAVGGVIVDRYDRCACSRASARLSVSRSLPSPR